MFLSFVRCGLVWGASGYNVKCAILSHGFVLLKMALFGFIWAFALPLLMRWAMA